MDILLGSATPFAPPRFVMKDCRALQKIVGGNTGRVSKIPVHDQKSTYTTLGGTL